MTLRLIIFDCDGVLVDSELLAMRVLLETVAAQGVTIDSETGFRSFLGRSLSSVLAGLNANYGIHLGDDALTDMRARLYGLYARELRPMAGLIDALEAIDLPACVASSSHMERIRVSLTLTGLIGRFEPAIFSAAMVAKGKPAPDLFLYAALEMGTPPRDCVVIEDSPAGILAAQRAGMRVFAFTGGGHFEPAGLNAEIAALKPDAIFADMHELPRLVQEEQARQKAQ